MEKDDTGKGGPRPEDRLAKRGPGVPEKRVNEFADLTPDARHELALRRIREDWDTATRRMTNIGRTLVDACYDGDESEALGEKADRNALFVRIARSAGTLAGGPSQKALSGARRVAAVSDSMNAHYWTVVPYSHKVLLVRLDDTEKMAEGAQKIVKFGWTLKQTEKWIDAERAAGGDEVVRRGRRLGSTRTAFVHLDEAVQPESLERVAADYAKLDAAGRAEVDDELGSAAQALERLRHRLRVVRERTPAKPRRDLPRGKSKKSK